MSDIAMAHKGKTAEDENFPVGSRLIPAALRPHVAAYYRFARLADDIGDSPALTRREKLRRLDALDGVLKGTREADEETDVAARLRAAMANVTNAAELLIAFRRDARNEGCADWAALMDYCRYSAVPVGRFLLDLHGEEKDTWPAGDALCSVHQILNHIQDVRDDYVTLGRVYVPQDWMAEEGLTHAILKETSSPPALLRVFSRMLDNCDKLLDQARLLPPQISNRGLRMEAQVIIATAERLASKLRNADPLHHHVKLNALDWGMAMAAGLIKGFPKP